MSAPKTITRENLERSVPFGQIRQDGGEAGGEDAGRILDGFGAVFNRETIIDSWEGRFKETIKSGSMAKSFREKTPRIQFDHGRHPMVGSIPIAQVRTIEEATHPELAPEGGAHVVARLHNNWLIEPVREAIASGAVNGMSFRFSVVRDKWFTAEGRQITDDEELFEQLFRSWWEDVPDDELLTRELWELRVPEMGPVVWPAYEETSVGVRSLLDLVRGDQRLQKFIRRGLAVDDDKGKVLEHITHALRNAEHGELAENLLNPEFRKQVARELVRPTVDVQPSQQGTVDTNAGDRPDAPPETGHPEGRSDDAPPESGHPSEGEERTDDAPPDTGHPSEVDDAPPESGHPSEMTHSRMGAEDDLVAGLLDYAVRVGPDIEHGDEE